MAKVYQRASARRDLVEHFVHLAENAGLETADRFLSSAKSGFELLASQPHIGAPFNSRHPKLAGMRRWRVSGFDDVLIFYLPRPDGVAIIRVLHGARDWWGLLGLVP